MGQDERTQGQIEGAGVSQRGQTEPQRREDGRAPDVPRPHGLTCDQAGIEQSRPRIHKSLP
jgi:hypothetical protein